MKVKENYVLKKVADSYLVVPIGNGNVDFNTVISLNESGAFLWKALEQETDRDTVVAALLGEYEVAKETAEADVDRFLAKMKDAGLLA